MLKKLVLLSFSILLAVGTNAQQMLESKAKRFLAKQAEEWNLSLHDVESTIISDMYTSDEGNTYIYFQQAKDGIPIHNAVTPVVLDKNGKIYTAGHRFVANIADMVTTRNISVDAAEAVNLAVKELGLEQSSYRSISQDGASYIVKQPSFAHNDIEVSKIYVYHDNQLRLGWSMAIDEKEDADYYNMIMDAASGDVLVKHNYTLYCQFDHNHNTQAGHTCSGHTHTALCTSSANGASYNVFPFPVESPIHGDSKLVTNPHVAEASPYGWHDTNGIEGAEYTITRGNNVHAYADTKDKNQSSGGEPDGGASLTFDFKYIQADSIENANMAQTNLFYAINRLHDVAYLLGFDEKAGNFQVNNYGKSGIGNDPVKAEAFDGFQKAKKKLNNANFSTLPDGISGRMQMFLWDNSESAVKINSPSAIEGFIKSYGTSTSFGGTIPKVDQEPIKGKIALAKDGSAGGGTTACKDIVNVDEVKNNIAIVDRGICPFALKTERAQKAGAIAVIICNVPGADGAGSDGENIINMSGKSEVAKIPALFFKKSDCDRIKLAIREGKDVMVTLQETNATKKYLDGSLDNGIVAHEYGHGISLRLIGGPSIVTCLDKQEQAGEGISDFISLIMTAKEGDNRNDPRGIGNYAIGLPAESKGIRRFPYSCDMDINPLTYNDMNSIDVSARGFIYHVGEIWATMLWEVFWNIVDKKGLDSSWKNKESGNFIASRLVIEGMKMSPCEPTFIQARDAILKADEMLYDKAHTRLIWEGFAKRGLGYFASSGKGPDTIHYSNPSFEIDPLLIKELKIKKEMPSIAKAKQKIDVKLTVTNHIEKTVKGVKIEDQIPSNMTYVEGSSNTPAQVKDGKLVIDIESMNFKDVKEITYKLAVAKGAASSTTYYQNFEDFDPSSWDREALKGTSFWKHSDDFANSGEYTWYIQEPNDAEIDQTLVTEKLNVVGEQPMLKFWHRYDTEPVNDGGFVQISDDNRQSWKTVQASDFKRNGYNTSINYSTFAIPSLEGYTGTTQQKYIDSYIDLAPYSGKSIHVRFRFGTNEKVASKAEYPGWAIDDVEMIDLKSDGSIACVSASNVEGSKCSENKTIIYESTAILSPTKELPNDVQVFEVAPNPASQYITVNLQTSTSHIGKIQLVNTLGQVVQSMAIQTNGNPIARSFDVQDLQSGMYVIQYIADNTVISRKVIVQ